MNTCRALLLGAASLLLTAGLAAAWQRNVTLHGVIFTKVRTGADGLHVGHIDTETVEGRPPRCGHATGDLYFYLRYAGCCSNQSDNLAPFASSSCPQPSALNHSPP